MPDQHHAPYAQPQPGNRPPQPVSVPARVEFQTSREGWGIYRCPCTSGTGKQVVLHQADRDGRICEAPDWEEHQTVTCRGCGRFGRLLHAHPGTGEFPVIGTGEFPVIGTAELPGECPECLAPAGDPCRDPFCPGQHAPLPARHR
ncbi:hypothetical protein [Pseudonocardia sp. KRD291]|uniref:hypothetical protein n=1 Tax=Pseudonocardia sp. KRD291 TaxID=2792007 RepID=UPI001C4A27C9|nr:hypothetical protein [Pseudonocardia sp. KRD291]MBW0102945.1 hypothetical protein [Pseudonocardia sp. KRD291]